MNFAFLFSAFLTVVAVTAASLVARCLSGRARLLAIVFFVLWLGYAAVLGRTGVVAAYDHMPPGIARLILPIVVTLMVLTLGRPGAVLARQLSLKLLIGFQVFRVGVELALHELWSIGLAPKIMTLEGGNIEILVAVTAPVAAWLVTKQPVGRRIAWAWNLVGFLSLANIVVRAVLSSPGPQQMIHAEVPDMAILTYPFTFIPGFMAPIALAIHVLTFRAFRATANP